MAKQSMAHRLRQRRCAALLVAVVAASGVTALASSPAVSAASSTHPSAHAWRVRAWRAPTSAGTRARLAAGAPSVPMWHRTVVSGGVSYPISMVGKNPFVHQTNPVTTVPTFIVPISLTFTDTGDVYDPTAADHACLGGATAVARTLRSPVFTKRAYTVGGTSLGTGQFVDIFQRANFFKFTKPGGINPGYHVNLAVKVLPKLELSVTGTELATACGKVGMIDINTFEYQLLAHLDDFAAAGVTSKTFPLLLLNNVVMYDGTTANCCILGFHAAIENPNDGGVQTFAVAEYDSTRLFHGNNDVGVITHEVGEWMDDPVGPNTTPSWGHIGQVSGCQENLEVGDPLTGTAMTVVMPSGVYHPQEMAFFSWFFPTGPSTGLYRRYSMNGTFKTPAQPCT